MRASIHLLLLSFSTFLVACGSSEEESIPGNTGTGRGGTGTFTISGDAASGVATQTGHCMGLSLFIPSITSSPVELIAKSGDAHVDIAFDQLADSSGTAQISLTALGRSAPATMTESTPNQSIFIVYKPHGSPPMAPMWHVNEQTGTYTLTITSRTPTDLTNCLEYVALGGVACNIIHGTAHAALQGTSATGAAGVVTFDATF